jgi:hypothetical protein
VTLSGVTCGILSLRVREGATRAPTQNRRIASASQLHVLCTLLTPVYVPEYLAKLVRTHAYMACVAHAGACIYMSAQRKTSAVRLQVFSSLPHHLQISVLQAADVPLAVALARVPRSLHPTVLLAHYPSISGCSSSRIRCEALPAVHVAEAVATFSHLTLLHLSDYDASDSEFEHDSEGTQAGHLPALPASYPRSAQRHPLVALADMLCRLQSLRSLTLASLALPEDAPELPFPPMPRLPHLTHLRLSGLLAEQAAQLLSSLCAPSCATDLLAHCIVPARAAVAALDLPSTDLRCGARTLAAALAALTHLRALDLCDSRMCSADMKALVPALQRLTLVTRLTLARCSIGREGAKSLVHLLRALPQLEHLDLTQCGLCADAACLVAAALASLQALSQLDLGYNFVRDGGVGSQALARSLCQLPRLQRLGLPFCKLCDPGIQAVASSLTGACERAYASRMPRASARVHRIHACADRGSLAGLQRLQHIHLGGAMGTAGAEAVAVALTASSASLRSLSLDAEKPPAEPAAVLPPSPVSRTLAPALGRLAALQELKFCATRAERFVAAELAPALARLTALTALELRYGNTAGAAADAFAAALGQLTNLQHVMLVSCIRAAEATILVPALGKLTRMSELYLYCSRFDDAGSDLLAATMLGLPLQKLGLCYCQLTYDQGARIVATLGAHTSIQQLGLLYNAMSGSDLDRLALGKLWVLTEGRFNAAGGAKGES